jgi:hypothetical protein
VKTAAVVVGDSTVIDHAFDWARDGLVGPSAWVDVAAVVAAVSPEERQRWAARVIDAAGNPAEPQPLSEYLSGLGALDEVRIVWVRSWSGDRHEAAHVAVEAHVGSILGHVGVRHLVDIVVPDALVMGSRPEIIPRWAQLVVVPEDRPAPGQPDAGWVHRAAAINLHAVLVLAGLLGGTVSSPPARVDVVTTVSAWSRLMGGAASARQAVTAYLDTTLPTVCAADADGEHFTFFDEESAAIERVSRLVQAQGDGALGYRPPAPVVLAPAPSIGWRTVLRLVWASFRMLMAALFGRTHEDQRTESMWDAADLGYHAVVAQPSEGDAEELGQSGEPWEAVDQRYRAILRRRLSAAAVSDGHLPPATVWSHLTRMACALVDGGSTGDGAPQYVGHGMVVRPRWVDPAPTGLEAGPRPEWLDSWRELRDVTSLFVIARVVHRVREQLETEPDAVITPDRSVVTRTAQRLAGQVSAIVHATREEQRVSLPEMPAEDDTISLTDGLYIDIVSRSLRSRLDGDRWAHGALSELSPGDDRDAATRRARALAAIGIGLGGTGSSVWAAKGSDIREWLRDSLTWDVPTWSGYAVSALLALAFVGAATRMFHVAVMALAERRARILEIRVKLAERAAEAYAQSRVLEHAARIMGQWHGILGALFPTAPTTAAPISSRPQLVLPRAMQRLEPVMTSEWLTRVHVAPTLARPGWRWLALHQVIDRAAVLDGVTVWHGQRQAVATIDDVFASDGLPGSVLDRVHREVRSGRPWRRWREAAVAETTTTLVDALRAGARPLRLVTSAASTPGLASAEVTPRDVRVALLGPPQAPTSPVTLATGARPGESWTWSTEMSDIKAAQPNPDTCAVMCRVVGWEHTIDPSSAAGADDEGGDR